MIRIDNKILICDKCGGRVFTDREYLAENHLELSCLACGKRWIWHNRIEGDFATWLHSQEMILREWTTNH